MSQLWARPAADWAWALATSWRAVEVQLPIFFKLGYTKAKLITYVPLVLVPLVLYLFSAFTDFTGLKELSDQVVL